MLLFLLSLLDLQREMEMRALEDRHSSPFETSHTSICETDCWETEIFRSLICCSTKLGHKVLCGFSNYRCFPVHVSALTAID